jgi:hypothetical protein
MSRLARCAIEPAESGVARKPPRRKKITTQVSRGWPFAAHAPVNPEPIADRKPPALFAFPTGAGTCSSETLWSPSFPLVFFALDRVIIWVLAWGGSPAPSDLDGAGSPRVSPLWVLFLADTWALFWSSVFGESSPYNNNNNTFTWSGPSGVLDCTGQRPGRPAAV